MVKYIFDDFCHIYYSLSLCLETRSFFVSLNPFEDMSNIIYCPQQKKTEKESTYGKIKL